MYVIVDTDNSGVIGPFVDEHEAAEFISKRARDEGWGDVCEALDRGEGPFTTGLELQDFEFAGRWTDVIKTLVGGELRTIEDAVNCGLDEDEVLAETQPYNDANVIVSEAILTAKTFLGIETE